jgi:hypothetical protein
MKQNKLRVRWNKFEKDLWMTYPIGIQTKCDANYMCCIFNREFIEEIKKRGYDITTLKFEITVDEKNERFPERFPTLYQEFLEKQ